jgi:hypothetical protein
MFDICSVLSDNAASTSSAVVPSGGPSGFDGDHPRETTRDFAVTRFLIAGGGAGGLTVETPRATPGATNEEAVCSKQSTS